uniref:hypothetical protein n=1 Tax=Halomonas hibernica TaxID=2591147 RepID=UPI0029E80040|nr:hypothetical protein [Halomonas hibernica]
MKRFNSRARDELMLQCYASSEDMEHTLKRYSWLYNHHIPQKLLRCQPSIEGIKEWQSNVLRYFQASGQSLGHINYVTFRILEGVIF